MFLYTKSLMDHYYRNCEKTPTIEKLRTAFQDAACVVQGSSTLVQIKICDEIFAELPS